MKATIVIAAAALVLAVTPAVAGTVCHTPQGAERKAILDVLRGPVVQDLKQPVEFVVRKFRVCETESLAWAFIDAKPQQPGGGKLDWEGAGFADCSQSVFGLAKRTGNAPWVLIEKDLCPTDVSWDYWHEQHGAPQALFKGLYD